MKFERNRRASLASALLLLAPVLSGCADERPHRGIEAVTSESQVGVAPAGPREDAFEADSPSDTAARRTAAEPGTGFSADAVGEHRLDMTRMRAWFDAMMRIGSLREAHPELEEALTSDAGDPPEHLVEKIRREPRLVEALREAGLTPRDYVMTTLAYVQAGMTAALQERDASAEIPDDVNAANVEFVRENRAELERMGRTLHERYGPAAPGR